MAIFAVICLSVAIIGLVIQGSGVLQPFDADFGTDTENEQWQWLQDHEFAAFHIANIRQRAAIKEATAKFHKRLRQRAFVAETIAHLQTTDFRLIRARKATTQALARLETAIERRRQDEVWNRIVETWPQPHNVQIRKAA